MSRNLLLAVATASLMLHAADSCGGEVQRFERDLDGAENAILSSLIIHRNAKSKYLCVENPYACVGPDRAELGLAMLSSSNQAAAPKRLVGLIRFRFDAGLSTDYKCYLHARKKEVSRRLREANADLLSRQCATEVARFTTRARRGLYEVPASSICRSPSEIRAELKLATEVVGSPGCDGF